MGLPKWWESIVVPLVWELIGILSHFSVLPLSFLGRLSITS